MTNAAKQNTLLHVPAILRKARERYISSTLQLRFLSTVHVMNNAEILFIQLSACMRTFTLEYLYMHFDIEAVWSRIFVRITF